MPPKSSEYLAGSSLGFVKPMPKRGHDSRIGQEDSAEFDIGILPPNGSALETWQALQPNPDDPGYSSVSCAGVTLGHFQVEEQIGRGGMGAVFRAIDTRLDREVALKVLAGPQSTDKSSVDRFLNEARAAARLDHDNVARVFYVGEDRGLHFIAFEFIHGANIRQVIEARGTLSPAETVNYGLQIANALRHITAAGVVHRDVKPSNIIITPTGRAKLVDLGLARKHDPEASRDLTVDGTTLGTFDYISPEQAKDPRQVDIRSDIYSLGCTLYHMLTGEPPYPRGTMLQKLLDHQHKDVPAVSSRNRSVPPELSAVVRKMMASDPAERYESADELISDLSILAHAYGLRPIAPGSVVWTVPARPNGWTLLRRYRAWIATAALLVVGVFAFDAMQSGTDRPVIPERAIAGTGSSARSPEHHPAIEGGPSMPPLTVDDSPPNTPASEPDDRTTVPEPVPDGDHVTDPQVASSGTSPADMQPGAMELPGFNDPLDGSLFQPLLINPLSPELGSMINSGDLVDPEPEQAESGTVATKPKVVPSPPPPPVAENVPAEPFVVRVDGEDPQGFVSLEAACNAAPDGGVIELNFDGRLSEKQRPLRIEGKRLRIRRGPGRRPIVRFAVPENRYGAEVVRMIAVSRGSLEVYDVGFEVTVDPAIITDRWVLMSLSRVDEVILQGVSVTMQNPNRHPAAIFELAEESSRFNGKMPDAMDPPPVRFEAEDCFFRGQADLFLGESVDPARIRLSNVAVALNGSLIHLRGMEAIDVLTDLNNEHRVELDLRHLTALLAAEVVKFDIEPGMSVPRVSVTANNSILVNGASRPLVSMSGEIDPFDGQQLLEWFGDHCFVQTQDPVWSISGPNDNRDYDLAQWNDLWKQGHLQRPTEVNLLRRDRSLPYDEMTAEDLTLVISDTVANPAAGGASDGTDAGVQWDSLRLPTLIKVRAD